MSEVAESKPSLKRYAPCGCVILMFAILVLVPAVSWMVWSTAAARRLEDEIAKIRAAGEPVDAADLDAFYVLPPERKDVTEIWLSVTESFASPSFGKAAETVPIVGTDEEIPPVGEPWKQLAATEELLKLYDNEMQQIHEATRLGAGARFDLAFEEGITLTIEHVQQMRTVSRMLQLEAHVHAHRGDKDGLVKSLRSMIVAPRALEQEPLIISQLVSNAMNGIALATLEEMIASMEFSDEDLKLLQETVRENDLHAGIEKAIIGERVLGLQVMQDPSKLGNGTPVRIPGTDDNTAFYLKHMAAWIEASRQPFPEALDQVDQADQALQEEMTSALAGLRYQLTATMLPAIRASFDATARGVGSTRVADTAIAIERFRRQHGKLPESLEELVPDFLTAVPIDPLDGQQLRFVITENSVLVYSVGRNRQDDDGVLGDERLDEVFRLPLEAVTNEQASLEPAP